MSSNGISLGFVRKYADNTSFGGRASADKQKPNGELHGVEGQQRVVSVSKDNLDISAVPSGRKDVLPTEEVSSKTLEERNVKVFGNKADEAKRTTAVEGRVALAEPERAAQMKKLKEIASAALGSREGTKGGKGYLGLGEDGAPVKLLTHWRERMAFSTGKLTQDEKNFVNDSTNRLRHSLLEIAGSLGKNVEKDVSRLLSGKQKGDVEFLSRESVAKAVSEIAKHLQGKNGKQFQWAGVVHAGTVSDTSVRTMFENRRHAVAANLTRPEAKSKVLKTKVVGAEVKVGVAEVKVGVAEAKVGVAKAKTEARKTNGDGSKVNFDDLDILEGLKTFDLFDKGVDVTRNALLTNPLEMFSFDAEALTDAYKENMKSVVGKLVPKADLRVRKMLLLKLVRHELENVRAFVEDGNGSISTGDRVWKGMACLLALREAYVAETGLKVNVKLPDWQDFVISADPKMGGTSSSEPVFAKKNFLFVAGQLLGSLEQQIGADDVTLEKFLDYSMNTVVRLDRFQEDPTTLGDFLQSIDDFEEGVFPETDESRTALQNASLEKLPDVAGKLQANLFESLRAAVDCVEGKNVKERMDKVLHYAVRLELERIVTFCETSPLPEEEKVIKGQAWMLALSCAYTAVVDAAQESGPQEGLSAQKIAEGTNDGEVVLTDEAVALAKEQMTTLQKHRFTNDDDVAAFVNQFHDNMETRFAQNVGGRASLSSSEKVKPLRGEKQKVAKVQAQKSVGSSKPDPLAREYGRVEAARTRLFDSMSDEEACPRTVAMANAFQAYMTAAVASKIDSKGPAGKEALLLRIVRTELKAICTFALNEESDYALSDRTRLSYACILALRQAYLAVSGREKMPNDDGWVEILIGARASQNEAEESLPIFNRTSFLSTGLELTTNLDRLLQMGDDMMLGRFLELARHSTPRLAEVKVNVTAANEFETSLDESSEKEFRDLSQARLGVMASPSGNGGHISGTMVEDYRKAYRSFLKAASNVYLKTEGPHKIMMAAVQDRAKESLDKMVGHVLRLELERIAMFYADGRNGSDEKVLKSALLAFVALMETWAVQEDDSLIGERVYNVQTASLYHSLVDAARAPTPEFVGQLKKSLESLLARNFADENDVLSVFTQWAKQLNPPQKV